MKNPLLYLSLGASLACMPASADDAEVRERLAAGIPGVEAENIQLSPVPGLYEVLIGPRVVYVTTDGRYVVQGTVLDLQTQTNLTEPRRRAARAQWIAGLDESQMVVFEPTGRTRHTITVFTDVDCGYCRQMHAEIGALLRAGIRVRYLLYPRTGPGTEAAQRAQQVWCSEDRQAALTTAKLGREVVAPQCDTPVMDVLLMGRELPVTGTPTLVTQGGDVIPGYLQPAQLIQELNRLAAQR